MSQAGRKLALAISFGTAGVGISELALGFVRKGLGSLSAGLDSGAIFALVALLTRSFAVLWPSRRLTALTGAACLVLLLTTGVAQLLLPSASEQDAYRNAPVIAGVASLIVCLVGYLDWEARAGFASAAMAVSKAACRVMGALAIGAGIGFLQGATIHPGQPNMVQDGGALVGAVLGGSLGVASLCRGFAGPESATAYGVDVAVCLACGVAGAKLAGMRSMFLTPVVALLMLAILSGRRGGDTAPAIHREP
jgi:hypothetical protein